MRGPPFPVHLALNGWALLWARLELAGSDAAAPAAFDPLRRRVAADARSRHQLGRLPEDATVEAVRGLFRAAGCDPTRYRPSSEALLRRVLKGEDLPAIRPLVDFSNCLSVELATPCGLIAEESFAPPFTLRSGREGEAYDSLRGPFRLEGKPLLADASGPVGTPITDSQRSSVQDSTRCAWLVAYLPAAVLSPAVALARLEALLREAPIARLALAASSPGGAGQTAP